jgi:hypothetical protein
MNATTHREFEVVAPDLRKVWLLPGLALLAGAIGLAFAARQEPGALLAFPILLLAVAVVAIVVRRRSVRLEGGELKVAAGMHNRRVATADLDLAGARIVDLREHKALRPLFKSFGTSLPGYHAGHFRLRDRGRAFVLVTDPTRVLVLPERSGRRLLLSLRHPQALLDALSAHAPGPR